MYTTITSDKSKTKARNLCLLGFLGMGGLHDFYLGKYGKGLIKLFTINYMMIGTVIDLIKIMSGNYRDNTGQPLRK